jgi:inosine-uridine nucleoside N-ribohydrolase
VTGTDPGAEDTAAGDRLGASGGAGERPALIVDCDPGHDDACALVLAHHLADIVAITTVGGNAPLLDVTGNALLTTQLFGIGAEVHAGCPRPLVAEPRHAGHVHGERGFSGADLPPLTRSVASDTGVEVLVETVRSREGAWLIGLGPLTNIATALRAAPDLARRVAGISFMGGSAGIGNHTPVAEFNVLTDPEAAAIVVGSEAPVTMSGLDLTNQFVLDDRLVDDLALIGNTGAAVLAGLMTFYLDGVEQRTGVRAGGLHDPCAVLAVARPQLVGRTRRRVDVELTGAHTRGMTVVDRRPARPGDRPGNVDHCHTLDHQGARALLLEAVAAHG